MEALDNPSSDPNLFVGKGTGVLRRKDRESKPFREVGVHKFGTTKGGVP